MAQSACEIFVVGLRNAHAMEVQARELMERQSERLTDYPEVQQRLAAHLRETEQQLKRLEPALTPVEPVERATRPSRMQHNLSRPTRWPRPIP